MKSIAVFCGSSNGASAVYKEGAAALGKELAKRGITLVYGGASVGLMGAVADAVLAEGGKVIGVIPQMLQTREIAHTNLTELIVVESMHERKAKMEQLSDGFLALPGGPGTLEEFVEIYTWAQLGLHRKPFGLLNIQDYYEPLVKFFDHMTNEQFLQEKYRSMVLVDSNPSALLDKFGSYEPPAVKTYIKEDQT
ncbi:TIGR00730 family Rossman fold protein [Paenibacillus lutrae]|uniref:Cytokinin riboside 5'-monophosphate phosphoribohydrolase n=1 Tax=Paenibacillus lutrae TaxID=2078573 RepID=A0A7X3FHL1_9BACL|nr:TIGR00730 family Rossman fold protein [Paenibacillus lutrae]MVO99940.1 TIGR00730 family Rossman fold protein [Paenibacillus lutrae]